jgi:hypothetical protein
MRPSDKRMLNGTNACDVIWRSGLEKWSEVRGQMSFLRRALQGTSDCLASASIRYSVEFVETARRRIKVS